MAQISVNRTNFVDLDLNFSIHPVSSDVSKKVDINAIVTSLRGLIETNKYDRPFHPEISSQVKELLFENMTYNTQARLERVIRYVIENFEPRVKVLSVNVSLYQDNNHIELILRYQVIGSTDVYNTKFYLDRTV